MWSTVGAQCVLTQRWCFQESKSLLLNLSLRHRIWFSCRTWAEGLISVCSVFLSFSHISLSVSVWPRQRTVCACASRVCVRGVEMTPWPRWSCFCCSRENWVWTFWLCAYLMPLECTKHISISLYTDFPLCVFIHVCVYVFVCEEQVWEPTSFRHLSLPGSLHPAT